MPTKSLSIHFVRITLTLTACWLFAVNVSAADPGIPPSSSAEINDQKVGSVLFFPLFISSAASPNTVNTRISVTNTNITSPAIVKLLFVDGSTGNVQTSMICLTKGQTAAFLTSDIEPGIRGYLIAVAVNYNDGCPLNFNFLAGNSNVKLAAGHTATLMAEAVAAVAPIPATCSITAATLNFDGTSYNKLPRTLALSKIRSSADGDSMQLIVNRIGGNLATNSPLPVGTLNGELINDLGASFPYSFTESTPQLFSLLSNTFPVTSPTFTSVIPTGRTGWMTVFNTDDAGLLGALINFNSASATNATAFKSGHNLQKLTLATSVTLTIPVSLPSC